MSWKDISEELQTASLAAVGNLLSRHESEHIYALALFTSDDGFLYAPAEDGNPHGQYQLGKMYMDGNQWVGVDSVKARYWLAKSADRGFARAKRLLEDL